MSVTVRDATEHDWPAVCALLVELGRPAPRAEDDDALRDAWRAYLEREDTAPLVAVTGEHVIGFCSLEFKPRLNFLKPMAWIPDLVVTESERSRGAGALLLKRAEQLARERGCVWMELDSANWRTRAHAFYRREGWNGDATTFTKVMSGGRWPPPPPDTAG